MTYYIFIQDDKPNGCGQCRQLTEGVTNFEVEEALYNAYAENPDMYIWTGENIVIDSEWEEKQAQARKEVFTKDFFQTSLGYVRRKVSMATGETKDFLSDLLPTISMGVQMGQPVSIITYNEPDFTTDEIDWVALQEVKTVTAQFVQECFMQLSNDFKPVEPEQPEEQEDDSTTNNEQS